MINNHGPNLVPWGTPAVMASNSEKQSSLKSPLRFPRLIGKKKSDLRIGTEKTESNINTPLQAMQAAEFANAHFEFKNESLKQTGFRAIHGRNLLSLARELII